MCTGTHPFIPVADTARVRMVYSYLGEEVMNVFYWKGDAPLIASDLSGLVDEVHTAWAANQKAHQLTGLTLLFIEATALDTDGGAQVTLPVNETGIIAGAGYPGGVTIAIKFSSGLSGRSNRGRMYWTGIGESQASGNVLLDAVATAFVADMTNFFDAVETATGLTHVVVSYCNDGAWRTTGVATPIISYLLVDKNLDSQRRRLAGRGI